MIYANYLGCPKETRLCTKKSHIWGLPEPQGLQKNPKQNQHYRFATQAQPFLKSSNGLPSKSLTSASDVEETHGSNCQFKTMKGTVKRILDQHSIDNQEVQEGLHYLMAILQGITNQQCRKYYASKSDTFNQDKTTINTSDSSTRIDLTLKALIEISKSRQAKQIICGAKHIRQSDIDYAKYPSGEGKHLSDNRFQLSKFKRQPSLDIRVLREEIIVLKHQKVQMMLELNKEMGISNRKAEEIKALESQLNRIMKNTVEKPNKLKRCLSGNLQTLTAQKQSAPVQSTACKDRQILQLTEENEQLRKEVAKMKQISFSESFLSQAFDFRDNQMARQSQHHQKTIQQQFGALENKIDSLNLNFMKSTSEMRHQSKTEATHLKKISQLEYLLKLQQTKRQTVLKQLQHSRQKQKYLLQQLDGIRTQCHQSKCLSPNPSPKHILHDYKWMKQMIRDS